MKNNTEKIGRYLQNEMSAEERTAFEKQLAGDRDLQQELVIQKQILAAVEKAGLKNHNMEFVVIEKEKESIEKVLPFFPDLVYLVGDGTDDDLLKKAGVEKAVALISALPDDADNVFIVLSARGLNQKLQIISRASEESSFPKLRKAGADNVIMPDKIGGSHMATLISKPDVIEFMDFLSSEDGESVNMESVPYELLPPAIKDKPLRIVMEWNKTGVNCLGIKKQGREIHY